MKMRFSGLFGPVCLGLLATLFMALPFGHAQYLDESEHREGLHEYSPSQMALVGAKVHVSASRVIENAVLVIKDGKLLSVGAADSVEIPKGYPTLDMAGKEIYPGFIDAYRDVDLSPEQFQADYWNQKVRPELDVVNFVTDEITNDSARRGQGFVALLAAPKGTIVDGTGAIVMTGGPTNAAKRILENGVGQHLLLTASFAFAVRQCLTRQWSLE